MLNKTASKTTTDQNILFNFMAVLFPRYVDSDDTWSDKASNFYT